jgi:hypothetical protein
MSMAIAMAVQNKGGAESPLEKLGQKSGKKADETRLMSSSAAQPEGWLKSNPYER